MLRHYEIKIPEQPDDAGWEGIDTLIGGIFAGVSGLYWTVQFNPWPTDATRVVCTIEAPAISEDAARMNRQMIPRVFGRARRLLYPEMRAVLPHLLVEGE